MSEIKVGDAVAWADVPDGALVQGVGSVFANAAVRHGDNGWMVGGWTRGEIDPVDTWTAFGSFGVNDRPQETGWPWSSESTDGAVIVALSVPRGATGCDLYALADQHKVPAK